MDRSKERFTKIGELGKCLFCDEMSSDQLTIDHLFPKVLIHKPRKMVERHPLRAVVNSSFNKFTVCRTHHIKIDKEKMKAFKANANHRNVDPVGLLEYLKTYPLSDNLRYYDLQLGAMTEVNRIFIATVNNLNGELPYKLVTKYRDAVEIAKDFDQILEDKRIMFDRYYFSTMG